MIRLRYAVRCIAGALAAGAVAAAAGGAGSALSQRSAEERPAQATATAAREPARPADGPEYSAGAATVFADGRTAFSFPAANLTDAERTRFVIGNSFFRRNWVQAPASTKARDGLGPHFIARSCGGCHVQDGRGAPPRIVDGVNVEEPVALLMRLSVPGTTTDGGPQPEPVYGDQLDNAAISGVKPEGKVVIRTRAIAGEFADGTPYELEAPSYSFTELGYGSMRDDVMISPRVAPQLIGVGLLEAIPESEIRANAERQADAPGPVKGVPNHAWDVFGERMMLGRFGWKANVATVAHQSASAFIGDMGITSSRFPEQACTEAQADCRAAPRGRGEGGGHEIDDATFAQVVFYTATVAPPARRAVDDPAVLRGERLFEAAQCATCHRPSYVTSRPALSDRFPQFSSPALVGQTIRPYTDLLLHDMGEELADGRPDHRANGRQWRTPPLWGVGMIHEVNGHQRLLHDGRARGVLEAIMWHGGEARQSREHVRRLSAEDRAALVRFVNSL